MSTIDGFPLLWDLGLFEFNQRYKKRCSPRMQEILEILEKAMNLQDNSRFTFDHHPQEYHTSTNYTPEVDSLALITFDSNGTITEHIEQIQTQNDCDKKETQTTDGFEWDNTDIYPNDSDANGSSYLPSTSNALSDTCETITWDDTCGSLPSPLTSPKLGPCEGPTEIQSDSTEEQQYSLDTPKETTGLNLKDCPDCRFDVKTIIESTPYKRQKRF